MRSPKHKSFGYSDNFTTIVNPITKHIQSDPVIQVSSKCYSIMPSKLKSSVWHVLGSTIHQEIC